MTTALATRIAAAMGLIAVVLAGFARLGKICAKRRLLEKNGKGKDYSGDDN